MTYKQLIECLNAISHNVGNQETKAQKKLVAIFNKLKPYNEQYSELRELIRVDHASVDDKGNMLKDEKGDYYFTKEATKLMHVDILNLLNSEFDFKPIFVSNPNGLEHFNFLNGFVDNVQFETEEEL